MLFAEERHSEILKLLEQKKKLLVSELSERFNVTQATIRSDFKELEQQGKLRRAHGGAMLPVKMNDERSTEQKMVENSVAKKMIAKAAANTVSDGDTIIIDTGTTSLFFAHELLHKKNLKIVTNDLPIASFLEEKSGFSVMLLGGEVRRGYRCTYGPMLNEYLRGIHADTVYLAINGISKEHGLSTPDYGVAQTKRNMIAAANKVILLADSTKFGQEHFAEVCPIDSVDVLVTDADTPKEYLSAFKNAGTDIISCALIKKSRSNEK